MKNLENLVNDLATTNLGTSRVEAKAEPFVQATDGKGKRIHTKKLRGLQKTALGSFKPADADMIALLWDNRDQIVQILDQYRMLHGPGVGRPSGLFRNLTLEQQRAALKNRRADC